VSKAWPRLSVTLDGPRTPTVCQSCGSNNGMVVWQECDDADKPQSIYVPLCGTCSTLLIEPHPRLYRATDHWEPRPGAMPLCIICKNRDGNRCTHPDLKANGGQGLKLTYPKPTVAIVCGRGRGCRSHFTFHGPVSACAGQLLPPAPEAKGE
jgi:hypothetical protein